MNGHTTAYDSAREKLPLRVMILEKNLAALDARCRECAERTRSTLKILSAELSHFAGRVVEDVLKINKRIDLFVGGSRSRKKNGRG